MSSTTPYSSTDESTPPRLAVFLSTSGHSGVDKIMGNLLPTIARRGVKVDLLRIRNHGPYLTSAGNLRVLNLGVSHTFPALFPLIRYLREFRPNVLLSDKDRVNRVAIFARTISKVPTKLIVRTGTTVSKDLDTKKPFDRWLHRMSMRYFYPLADHRLHQALKK